jgi:biopolymer transport protein ExbD
LTKGRVFDRKSVEWKVVPILETSTGHNPSPGAQPSAELDLKEALSSSIFVHQGKTYYKIHIDSDGMTRISGRIVSNEELKTLKQHQYDPAIGIYLAVYGDQEHDTVNGVFRSLQNGGVWKISRHVSDQESKIMQRRE